MPELHRLRLDLELQLGGRWLLYLILDLILVSTGVLNSLIEPGEVQQLIWNLVFLVPLVGLGLPAASDVIALERRAGCLDLALASPASERYFLRRILVVEGVFLTQGWLVLLLAWMLTGRTFPLLPVLLQAMVMVFLVGSAVLFWAVRIQRSGGVWLASLITVLILAPWTLSNPVPTPYRETGGAWLPGFWEGLSWLGRFGGLTVTAILLFLYARRRLRRPEALIG